MTDAAGAGAAGGSGAAGGAAGAGAAGGTPAWHTGIDAGLIGHAQNKGWDMTDPVKAFSAAALAHEGAQKLIGLPPEKVLRMPEASADAAQLDAFWQRLGAPKEGKDLDFSAIKGADGKPIDEKLAEVLRSTAVASRAPKDVVLSVAQALQKHFDGETTAQKAVREAAIATDKAALKTSWGANEERNMFVANQALEKLAAAANVPMDKAKAAWDALAKVGGLGAVDAINMMYEMGKRMGEGNFVSGGPGGDLPMTRESAAAEITSLKGDAIFRDKLLKGDTDSNKRWTALHKIAFGQQNAA